jgi:hypothetical protein
MMITRRSGGDSEWNESVTSEYMDSKLRAECGVLLALDN